MRFRIYYADGSTYSDGDGSPYDAPNRGVEVVCQEENTEKGWGMMRGHTAWDSYLCWWPDPGCWQMHDLLGLHHYHNEVVGPQRVLHLKNMTDNEAYWAIVGRASKEGLG